MIELPICRWRGDALETGNFPCRSPKIMVGLGGVPGSLCEKCYLCNHEPPEGPSLLQKAVNFAGAVVNHIAQGMPEVTEEQFQARMKVCRNCPFFADDRCQHMACGCNLLIKARWASQSCPINKWPDT